MAIDFDPVQHFGREAVDEITQFKGRIVGLTLFVTGCDHVSLQPKAEGDKLPDAQNFDVTRVVLTKSRTQIQVPHRISSDQIARMRAWLKTEALDEASGIRGVVTAIAPQISGTVLLHLQPTSDSGNKLPKGYWYESGRVVHAKTKAPFVLPAEATPKPNADRPGADHTVYASARV